ncbi:DUF6086 family protein [Kitasatospora sp. NPDC093550]|uniref:DUF6086 family protein n=1 Tax=Kitasatospora sp. NPDC093550 TaxID=3364089 RepID=UPI0038268F74
MSQYYEMAGRTLWNPSNGASRLFLRQVADFEAELGQTSGIGPMVDDESEIDPAVFGAFVRALAAWHGRTCHHGVLRALSEGFVATTLALAERAGTPWEEEVSDPRLRERAREMLRDLAP